MIKSVQIGFAAALLSCAVAAPASAAVTFNWEFTDQSHPGQIVTGTISGLVEGFNPASKVTPIVTNAIVDALEGGNWASYMDGTQFGFTVKNGAVTYANAFYLRGNTQFLTFGSAPATGTSVPSLEGREGSQSNRSQPNRFSLATTPASAVPEPASWAMMISGIGMAGMALRQRRRVRVAVRFA